MFDQDINLFNYDDILSKQRQVLQGLLFSAKYYWQNDTKALYEHMKNILNNKIKPNYMKDQKLIAQYFDNLSYDTCILGKYINGEIKDD